MPRDSSTRGGSNNRGGGHGGGGYRGGYYPWDSYWGGSYYWGGNYYYSGGYYYSPYYDRFYDRYGSYRNGYPSSYSYAPPVYATDRLPVFFPPTPPPLGAPTPPRQPAGLRLVAPLELAAYVDEPFYAPLSTRLAGRNLTGKLRQRLDSYRAAKIALQTELRAKLDALKGADPATRQRELEAFAPLQTPQIVELEKAAEQLRGDALRNGLVGLFGGSGDWNEHREWRLGQGSLDRPRAETLSAEFQVVRAAVFYQEGLAPAQRRLLREVAMEVQVEAYKPKSAPASPEDSSLTYFSPETARVRLPDDLSAEIAVKVEAYVKEKTEVKTELRDAIYQQDKATSAQRVRALKQLAENQTPRIAALEILAEDIRQGLALQPKQPGPPSPPSLSPELATRISAYQKEKLARLVSANTESVAGKSVDALLKEFEDVAQKQEAWQQYGDYQIAVFQPGLSPEQRRLLFDAAMEKLALPLPGGERQP